MTSKSQKILFLDIDGPMIPYRCLVMPKQTPIMTLFDPVAVSLLNHLCDEHGWEIVLHSSWVRIEGGEKTHQHCIDQGIERQHFHQDAWCNEHIDWRYSRVAEWLSRHPEVDKYVMVDDEPYAPDECKEFEHPVGMSSRLVLVNYYDGFLFSTYNDIKAKDHD
jgi:hypothetical protein